MAKARELILEIAEQKGIIRSRDVVDLGFARVHLTRLVKEGVLVRVGHGLYTHAQRTPTENSSLAAVAVKSPKGVICLLSALRFHDLTTQSPFEVWVGIPNKSRPPKMEYPPLRIIRLSAKAMEVGVEEHTIENVKVQVTCPARTVVDCFKFRNKIGLDVALEALREAKEHKANFDDIWRYAMQFRVSNIMRPYMENL